MTMKSVIQLICIVFVVLGLAFGVYHFWQTTYAASVAAFLGALAFLGAYGLA